MVRGDHLVAGRGRRGDDVVPELPAGARDDQPHQNAARALSGSHQSRWSRYHSTVRASASSRSCSVDQPSSATLSVVIE